MAVLRQRRVAEKNMMSKEGTKRRDCRRFKNLDCDVLLICLYGEDTTLSRNAADDIS